MKLPSTQIGNISTMADGSVKIVLYANEMSPADMATLFLAKKNGIMIPEMEIDGSVQGKTQAQRLRNVLYLLWKQENRDETYTQEMHYRDKMNEVIEHFKKKLQ